MAPDAARAFAAYHSGLYSAFNAGGPLISASR